MPKIMRIHDGSEVERRITLIVSEENAPGAIEFLSSLPYGKEGPFIRAVVYQWLLANQDKDDLTEAIQEVLQGPGGDFRRGGLHSKKRPGPKQKLKFNSGERSFKPQPQSAPIVPSYQAPKAAATTQDLEPQNAPPSQKEVVVQSVEVSTPTPPQAEAVKPAPANPSGSAVEAAPPPAAQPSPPEKQDSNIMPFAGAQASSSSELTSDDIEALDSLDRMF